MHTETVLGDLPLPNGMVWSDDDSAYFLADSADRAIYRYDFDARRGLVRNRTTVFSFQEKNVPGCPDGITMDEEVGPFLFPLHSILVGGGGG